MRSRAMLSAVTLICLASFAGAAPVASMTELEQMLTAKDYVKLQPELVRVMRLKDPKAEGFDISRVWAIKGEMHLAQKQIKNAGDAFDKAGEVAPNTTATPEQLQAQATAILIRSSKPDGYVTKSPPNAGKPNTPVDIVDPESRKNAMILLIADTKSRVLTSAANATKTGRDKALVDAVTEIAELEVLIKASGNDDAEVTSAKQDVEARLHKLIGESVTDMDQFVRDAASKANQPRLLGGMQNQGVVIRTGLISTDKKQLEVVKGRCKDLATFITELEKRSGEADTFEGEKKQVQSLYDLADKTLTDDYSKPTGGVTPSGNNPPPRRPRS